MNETVEVDQENIDDQSVVEVIKDASSPAQPAPTPDVPQQPQVKREDPKVAAIEELSEAVDPRTIFRDQRVAGLKDSGYENFDRTYTQRRLSSFPRLEFIRVVSKSINDIVTSDDTSMAQFASDLNDGLGLESAEVLVRLFSRLAMTAPETIAEVLLISLGVPNHERMIVIDIWNQPEGENGTGGLSDKDMQEMLETFIDQNAGAINDFFRKTLPGLLSRTQKIINVNQK